MIKLRAALAALLVLLSQPHFAAGHSTLTEALDRLAAAFAADPRLSDVTVNRDDISITATLPDGTQITSHPDNLHATLGQATSAA